VVGCGPSAVSAAAEPAGETLLLFSFGCSPFDCIGCLFRLRLCRPPCASFCAIAAS
jgi:hypothetical protein